MSVAGEEAAPTVVIRRRRSRRGAAYRHTGAWKVAYADFVTAMMAFFMLLWLIATPDKGRLKGLAQYFSTSVTTMAPAAQTDQPEIEPGTGGRLRRAQGDQPQAYGILSAEAGTAGASRGGTANIPAASRRALADELKVALELAPNAAPGQRAVQVEREHDGARITLMDTAQQSIFVGPTAELNGYSRALLAHVARKLSHVDAQLAIEGHTSAEGGAQSAANWRLSGDRAEAARDVLVAGGLSPDRFAQIVARAGTQPIYPDQPSRAENRRIAIIVLSEPSVLPRDVSLRF
ncbi:OmpA family protein [Sphingomonas sp. RHCKR7]|uniref:flagellar motor protein MotB n=1 Tax=Sphingomonas folli TaxID=2862497 RepID=UPI001CA57DA2|nr:flagellar motor protein MotB [Sphingomonas folli]MBW6525560.1 OmpA family protein [Sphingomonas folli]